MSNKKKLVFIIIVLLVVVGLYMVLYTPSRRAFIDGTFHLKIDSIAVSPALRKTVYDSSGKSPGIVFLESSIKLGDSLSKVSGENFVRHFQLSNGKWIYKGEVGRW